MSYTHPDGELATNEQERIALEQQGYRKCRNAYCTFMVSPEVLEEISQGTVTPEEYEAVTWTCPHCGFAQQPFARPKPGGNSSAGVTNTDLGQIGEDIVEGLGHIGHFGPIMWWHKGGAATNSALDGATPEWGVEVKTTTTMTSRTRVVLQEKAQNRGGTWTFPKQEKAQAVNEINALAAQFPNDTVLQRFLATNPQVRGLVVVVVVCDFETNTANVYAVPFEKDPETGLLDPASIKTQINYNRAQGAVGIVSGVPFTAELPDPSEPGFVPFSEKNKAPLPDVFSKTADFGTGGDAYPAQEPQAREDRQHVNDSYGQESAEHDTITAEYNFVWANGELDVSGQHEHQELLDRNNVPSTHTGPMAVGNVTVEDGVALWEVASNAAGGSLIKVLKKYTDQAGWNWGGVVDKASGHPLGDGEKVSHLFFTNKDGVKLSKVSFNGSTAGRIDIFNNKVARVWYHPEATGHAVFDEAIREWADDFGVRLAEYPGGGNMNDMLKNYSPAGEDYEQHNLYDPGQPLQPDKDRDRTPIGIFKCPDCGVLRHRWNEYLLHRRKHEPIGEEVEDGKFPEINDGNYHEWDPDKPGVHTGGWQFTAEKDPKDMFDQPVPFIYDIEEDAIHVGHPGGRHAEIKIPQKYTPGGIVEGEYQPGGKVIINTVTSTPYSIRHLVGLWYYSHPEFEVTGVEITKSDGSTHKVANRDVAGFVTALAAQDPAVHGAWQALRNAGGRVYVVGGAVRDALMQKTPKDIDLMVTGIPPAEVDAALKVLPGRVDITGKDFGVYRYKIDDAEVEIALPRTEKSTGARRVDFDVAVDHKLPVEDDLLRRDFTANAIAVDLENGRIVDPFDGQFDIEKGVLRTVHPTSFLEDPTRIVRALVAHARHGLTPDATTREQMLNHGHSLTGESPERIQAELEKLMKSDNPAKAIRLAHDTGVLKHILPEVDAAFGFDQKNPHHSYDLGTHLLNVLEHAANQTDDPDVRMAALLHDIGKPHSQWINPETGIGHYYKNPETGEGEDHETVGAEMAEKRLHELKWYPRERIDRIRSLVQHHMYPDFSGERGARKFLNKVGPHANDLFTLRAADRAGKGTDDYQSTKTPVGQQKALVEAVRAAGQPTERANVAVNGNDLIGLGIQPGPLMGQILQTLTDLVVENPELNDKHTLLNYVRHELVPG